MPGAQRGQLIIRMCACIGKVGINYRSGEREPAVKFWGASLSPFIADAYNGDDAGISLLVLVSGDFRSLWPTKWISKGRFRRPKMLRITNKCGDDRVFFIAARCRARVI